MDDRRGQGEPGDDWAEQPGRGQRPATAHRGGASGWLFVTGAALLVVVLGYGALHFAGLGPQSPATEPPSGGRADGSGAFPDWVLTAAAPVREAYEFAVARPDVLRYVPCYCGCQSSGHRHNGDCFVKSVNSEGTIAFERHGFG